MGRYRLLRARVAEKLRHELSLSVARSADPLLFSILTKALYRIPQDVLNKLVTDHTSPAYTASLRDVLYTNPVEMALGLAISAFLLGTIALLAFHVHVSRKRNLELLHANTVETEFLSRMSHDIRTPMNAIVGMADLAALSPDNATQVKESLEIIRASSRHLLSIINDLLEMNKLDTDGTHFTFAPVSIRQEMENVERIVSPLFLTKKQYLSLVFTDIAHDVCLCEPTALQRVLLNLLNNAYKFTQESGEISLHALEKPTATPGMSLYEFQVKDNGIGIAGENLSRLFDPFFRGSAPASTEGTGLGLAIVKRIVTVMGGTVGVQSTPGTGTCFTVSLPLRHAAAQVNAKNSDVARSRRVDLSQMRALLVEDHPINRLVAVRLLEKCGAKVTCAENGKLGVNAFTASRPGTFNVIFMELQMPVMNGYEATLAIRACAHPQAKDIPIIAITANAYDEDVKRCLLTGFNGHIAKPISLGAIKAVLNIIENAAQGHLGASPAQSRSGGAA